jgi:hypothetical protein
MHGPNGCKGRRHQVIHTLRKETVTLVSGNAVLLRDFWFVAHPEASMLPVAGTPGSTFFDVAGHSFQPTWWVFQPA